MINVDDSVFSSFIGRSGSNSSVFYIFRITCIGLSRTTLKCASAFKIDSASSSVYISTCRRLTSGHLLLKVTLEQRACQD